MKPRDVIGAVFGPWPPRRIFALAAGAAAVLVTALVAPEFLGIGEAPSALRTAVTVAAVAVPAVALAELSCLAAPRVVGALARVARALRVRWAVGRLPREELRLLAFCVCRRYAFIWVYGDERGALRLCRRGLLVPSGHRTYFVRSEVWPHVDACLRVHPEIEKLAEECRTGDDAATDARVPGRQG